MTRPRMKLIEHRDSKLYMVWNDMKQRCYNSNNSAYKYYGGRGIKIAKEWEKDFEWFYMWAMENGYKEGLTIDRIDNDGDYSPQNCRWITMKEQNINKSNNIKIDYNGEHYNTLKAFCEKYNLNYSKSQARLSRGCQIEDLF